MLEPSVFSRFVKTPFGTFQLSATKRGLAAVRFPRQHFARPKSVKIPPAVRKHFAGAGRFLNQYLAGRLRKLPVVRIDWDLFSGFDRRVLTELRKIPTQTTLTYGDLAKRLRSPRGARAVGNSLNRNPIPILIPCHRIVRKDRSLGGYGPGLSWKRLFLNLERTSLGAAR